MFSGTDGDDAGELLRRCAGQRCRALIWTLLEAVTLYTERGIGPYSDVSYLL